MDQILLFQDLRREYNRYGGEVEGEASVLTLSLYICDSIWASQRKASHRDGNHAPEPASREAWLPEDIAWRPRSGCSISKKKQVIAMEIMHRSLLHGRHGCQKILPGGRGAVAVATYDWRHRLIATPPPPHTHTHAQRWRYACVVCMLVTTLQ